MIFAIAFAAMTVFGAMLALPGTAFGVEEVRARLDLTVATQARLILLMFTGFLAGTLVSGPLADHAGRRRVLIAACLVSAAGMAAFALVQGAAAAGFAIFLVGLGGSSINTVTNAIASAMYPERRGTMMNWLAFACGLGGASLPLFALAGSRVSWSLILLVAAGIAVACAALAARIPRGGERLEPFSRAGVTRTLALPGFYYFALALLFQGGNEASMAGWMTAYLLERGASETQALTTLSLHWAGVLASRVVIASTVEQLGKLRAIAIGATVMCAGILLLLFAPGMTGMMAGAVVAGLGVSGVFSTVMALAGDRYPDRPGMLMALLLTGGQIGGMSVPWTVGQIGSAAGLHTGLAVLAFTTLAVWASAAAGSRASRAGGIQRR